MNTNNLNTCLLYTSESKHAVVRYMKDHAREKDTAAWLAQEYGGSNSNSLFITRAGSPEEMQLPLSLIHI